MCIFITVDGIIHVRWAAGVEAKELFVNFPSLSSVVRMEGFTQN